MFLYLSIVPCDNNNNNNTVTEKFELPIQIQDVINTQTEILKDQTTTSNIFQKAVHDAITEIGKLKNKLQLMHQESESIDNSVLMFNTNGQLSKVV